MRLMDPVVNWTPQVCWDMGPKNNNGYIIYIHLDQDILGWPIDLP